MTSVRQASKISALVVLKYATTEFYNLSIICMQLKLFKIVSSLLKKTKIGFLTKRSRLITLDGK